MAWAWAIRGASCARPASATSRSHPGLDCWRHQLDEDRVDAATDFSVFSFVECRLNPFKWIDRQMDSQGKTCVFLREYRRSDQTCSSSLVCLLLWDHWCILVLGEGGCSNLDHIGLRWPIVSWGSASMFRTKCDSNCGCVRKNSYFVLQTLIKVIPARQGEVWLWPQLKEPAARSRSKTECSGRSGSRLRALFDS